MGSGLMQLRRRRPSPVAPLPHFDSEPERAASVGAELAGRAFPDPDVGNTIHPYYRRLREKHAAEAAGAIKSYYEEITPLKQALIEARSARNLAQGRANHWKVRRAKLDASEAEQVDQLAEDERARHRRYEGRFSVSGMVAHGSLGLMAAGEAALNYVVMLLLGAADWVTLMFTVALGIGQVTAAHMAGGLMVSALARGKGTGAGGERRSSKDAPRTAALYVLSLIGLSLIGSLITLSIMRGVALGIDQDSVGFSGLRGYKALLLFAFIQLLFNAVAFAFGAARHNDEVEDHKRIRSRRWWVALRSSRADARLSRAVARDVAAMVAFMDKGAWYEAHLSRMAHRCQEAIHATSDLFVRNAGLERAAALAEQAPLEVPVPDWTAGIPATGDLDFLPQVVEPWIEGQAA